MAGPTTAERGARRPVPSGPPRRPRKRRFRFPRPGRRFLLVTLALVVLVVASGAWVVYGSKWLRVGKVSTRGTRVLTPRQVTAAADVPLNTPLMSVDTEGIATHLRAQLPRIGAVDVVRVWPDEIRLKVTERKPEVLIDKGGKFIEVDSGGVRYATVPGAPKGVPLLELDASRSPSLQRFGPKRLEREAVRVAGGLPEVIHRDTRVVRVSSYDSITLELTGGRTVAWGSSERGAAKAKTLLALMKTARGAEHFDVSAPTAPVMSGS
ncbi:FtsQ-type POTRA domain-containing protein [Streptomyces sp. NPDC051776]|uniref:cell division protein FtsQ/DivIB n=1 Tax=Streptomyces sp. NPDC051776 TaxID=3155414 RepID=UPI0034186D8E